MDNRTQEKSELEEYLDKISTDWINFREKKKNLQQNFGQITSYSINYEEILTNTIWTILKISQQNKRIFV